MKLSIVSICLTALVASFTGAANAFVMSPSLSPSKVAFYRTSSSTSSRTAQHMAKYKSMDEILALFPEDKPVLINFYDAKTENAIKDDIFRAKKLLEGRATLVSVKQQDYPELAKLWDAADKTPSMILFKDGNPVARIYEETHYLEIVAKVGKYCTQEA